MSEEEKKCRICHDVISYENTFTEDGWKETEISQICEECFDNATLRDEVLDNTRKFIEGHTSISKIASTIEGVYLGGGIFRNFVDPTDKIEDIDLFFKDLDETKNVIDLLLKDGYQLTFECPKGELYSFVSNDDKVQLITKRAYENVSQMIKSFDLSPCRAGIELGTGGVEVCRTFVSSVLNKHMKVMELEYPLATMKRIMKYRDKGYFISSTALRDLIYMINEMELTDENMIFYVD